jgi:hypothetical protein
MASLVGKRRRGRTYYYLVVSARAAGKPRIVAQHYLCSTEEIAARLSQAGPGELTGPATGHLGAWPPPGLCCSNWRSRRSSTRSSVPAGGCGHLGRHLPGPGTCNQVVAPRSKLAVAAWWHTTAGDRLVKLSAAALDHRRPLRRRRFAFAFGPSRALSATALAGFSRGVVAIVEPTAKTRPEERPQRNSLVPVT